MLKLTDQSSKHIVSLFSFALLTVNLTAFSKSADLGDTTPLQHGDRALVSSDQMLDLATPTSSALRLEGEQSMRFNNIDKAIMVLEKSVQMSPGDMDGHILYAQALEKKLLKEKDRDPALYNFVIKQWLYVAKKAEYKDQANQGVTHLFSLTGQKPGHFENESHYLSHVMMPEDGAKKNTKKNVASRSAVPVNQ